MSLAAHITNKTCTVTFRIALPFTLRPEPQAIYLYGSWNRYTTPSRLERDSRSGYGIWKSQAPSTGLREGESYGYYYLLDDKTLWYDPSAELCMDIDIKQTVMVLDVPMLLPPELTPPLRAPAAASNRENVRSGQIPEPDWHENSPRPTVGRSLSDQTYNSNSAQPKGIKNDSPTIKFDESVAKNRTGQGQHLSLPSRNIKKRKSFTQILGFGGTTASTDNLKLERSVTLKKSWANILKGAKKSISDMRANASIPTAINRKHNSWKPKDPKVPIGLGITIPSDVDEQPKPQAYKPAPHYGHRSRPSLPDAWMTEALTPQVAPPPALVHPDIPARMTIRQVSSTSIPSLSSRGTRRQRSNACVERPSLDRPSFEQPSLGRRSESFEDLEPETPLDDNFDVNPKTSITSLDSALSEGDFDDYEDAFTVKSTTAKVFIPPSAQHVAMQQEMAGRYYMPCLKGLQDEGQRVHKEQVQMKRDLGWLGDVVIA